MSQMPQMPTAPHRVLIAEDDPKIARVLLRYLGDAGYDCLHLDNGAEVAAQVRQRPPALLVLDLMLPGLDGLSVCRQVRQHSSLPILMLTARIDEVDRLLGFECGADDYVCKPFSPREVLARVQVLIRRTLVAPSLLQPATDPATPPASSLPAANTLVLDEAGQRARLGGVWLPLTPSEYRLLALLSRRPGRAFSRGQLVEQLYGVDTDVSTRTVDGHVKNLRRKLCEAGAPPEAIASIYGVGYRFDGM